MSEKDDKFSKNFPSFNKITDYKIDSFTDEYYYAQTEVAKHCLDKQKVWEAINELRNTCESGSERDATLIDLLKKLSFEDKKNG